MDAILTGSAEKFVTPLTFQSVTGRRAYTNRDLWGNEGHVLHLPRDLKARRLAKLQELKRGQAIWSPLS